jgi:hypothetical protein
MSDVRTRKGKKGTTYQVRYPTAAAKSGYAYATFLTLKEARAFREDSRARTTARPRSTEIRSVEQAIQRWLNICEHEGRDGRDPVSPATLGVYKGCATIMRAYAWETPLHELESADLVAFRSWLLTERTRDEAIHRRADELAASVLGLPRRPIPPDPKPPQRKRLKTKRRRTSSSKPAPRPRGKKLDLDF